MEAPPRPQIKNKRDGIQKALDLLLANREVFAQPEEGYESDEENWSYTVERAKELLAMPSISQFMSDQFCVAYIYLMLFEIPTPGWYLKKWEDIVG